MSRTLEWKEKQKIYRQSPVGLEISKVYSWKSQGIIEEDLSSVYDYYLKETNCMVCFEEFKNSIDKCLDHDHETGEIRYICCRKCNTSILREKFSNPVHTKPIITNTSGHLNISYDKFHNKWIFSKMINGKRIQKTFHTKEEAVQYKIDNNY